MLHDVLVELAKDGEGLEVVDAVLSVKGVAERVRAARSDVVVLCRETSGLPAWAMELLEDYPRLRFLCLDSGGRSGDLYELRLNRNHIEGISADTLIAALQEPATSGQHPCKASRAESSSA